MCWHRFNSHRVQYLWLKLKICFIHEKSQMDLETEIIARQTTYNLKLKEEEIHTEAQQLQRDRFKRWRSKWLMSKNWLGSTPRCFSGDPDSNLTPLFSLWTQHFQGDWPSASSLTPAWLSTPAGCLWSHEYWSITHAELSAGRKPERSGGTNGYWGNKCCFLSKQSHRNRKKTNQKEVLT